MPTPTVFGVHPDRKVILLAALALFALFILDDFTPIPGIPQSYNLTTRTGDYAIIQVMARYWSNRDTPLVDSEGRIYGYGLYREAYNGHSIEAPKGGSVVVRVHGDTGKKIWEVPDYFRDGCCGYPNKYWFDCEENCRMGVSDYMRTLG